MVNLKAVILFPINIEAVEPTLAELVLINQNADKIAKNICDEQAVTSYCPVDQGKISVFVAQALLSRNLLRQFTTTSVVPKSDENKKIFCVQSYLCSKVMAFGISRLAKELQDIINNPPTSVLVFSGGGYFCDLIARILSVHFDYQNLGTNPVSIECPVMLDYTSIQYMSGKPLYMPVQAL